jgi:CcmD family protein
MDNIEFLGAAYLVIWLLLGGYTFSIFRMQKKILGELKDLKDRLSPGK